MGDFFISETFWLYATNGALGIVTLVCCAVVGWCMVKDIRQRGSRKEDESRVPEDYLVGLKDLGIAVEDARKKVDESQVV